MSEVRSCLAEDEGLVSSPSVRKFCILNLLPFSIVSYLKMLYGFMTTEEIWPPNNYTQYSTIILKYSNVGFFCPPYFTFFLGGGGSVPLFFLWSAWTPCLPRLRRLCQCYFAQSLPVLDLKQNASLPATGFI